jgi:hypothetical protein
MVTKFDHNLVMAGKPSTKVTLGLLLSCTSVNVIVKICQFLLYWPGCLISYGRVFLEHIAPIIVSNTSLKLGHMGSTTIYSRRAKRLHEYA